MSVEYCIQISEEMDSKLEQISEDEVKTAFMETLERLAERDENIQQQQDELHDRMGLNTDGEDSEELSDEELKREIQRFLRGERRTDPRLDN
jgi:hypothetical protein